MKHYIYAIKDPDTLEIRYIGCTTNPKQRELNHIYNLEYNRPKSEWTARLRGARKRPILEILEECNDAVWEERERWWIDDLRKNGSDLFNILNGGSTRDGFVHEPGARCAIGNSKLGNKYNAGKARTIEEKTNISKKLTGHIVSTETRDKIREYAAHGDSKIISHIEENGIDTVINSDGPSHKQVADIRRMAVLGFSARAIARMFKSSHKMMLNIIKRKTYDWLE